MAASIVRSPKLSVWWRQMLEETTENARWQYTYVQCLPWGGCWRHFQLWQPAWPGLRRHDLLLPTSLLAEWSSSRKSRDETSWLAAGLTLGLCWSGERYLPGPLCTDISQPLTHNWSHLIFYRITATHLHFSIYRLTFKSNFNVLRFMSFPNNHVRLRSEPYRAAF